MHIRSHDKKAHQCFAIKCFQDNYIWVITNGSNAIVIDPGDARPVIKMFKEKKISLNAILVTHHHADHVGGINDLLNEYNNIPVYGPELNLKNLINRPVKANDCINIKELALQFQVLAVPGHTLDHLAYFSSNNDSLPTSLFCGDTLFSCGCGKLFEGTIEQMFKSLQVIAALPDNTLIYSAHEYTLKNIKFALKFEPGNKDLIAYSKKISNLIALEKPSLPSSLSVEKKVNPFLRLNSNSLKLSPLLSQSLTLIDRLYCLRCLRDSY